VPLETRARIERSAVVAFSGLFSLNLLVLGQKLFKTLDSPIHRRANADDRFGLVTRSRT
jgi:hypothetical protein